MAEITRAEMGLGLFLGYLVTPRGRVIGEIRVPPTEGLRSLNIGMPAIAVDKKQTNSTTYEEICKIEAPESPSILSLEEVSMYASLEADYALFKIEIGDMALEDIPLAVNLVLSLPFRGRVELKTGQKVAIYVKTSDVAHTVKGHGSINGVIM